MTSPELEHERTHAFVFPELIRVERQPGKAAVKVYVDGVELPYAIAADSPISVDLERDSCPAIRLTLLARSVEVSDRLYADEDAPAEEQ